MIKHNKHWTRESGSNLSYPQQSLISCFSNQGRFPVCKTRRLDQMLSNVSASFNILWISECIPYRCNAQVQESSEPPSLALENQPLSPLQYQCCHKTGGASPTFIFTRSTGDHVKTKILVEQVCGGAETMHLKLQREADAAGPQNTRWEAIVLFESCTVEARRKVKRAREESILQRPHKQQLTFSFPPS